MDPRLEAKLLDPTVEDFFIVMAICNSVVVSTSSSAGNVNETSLSVHSDAKNGNVTGIEGADKPSLLDLKYEAESPDEAALVQVRDGGYCSGYTSHLKWDVVILLQSLLCQKIKGP